MAAYALKFRPRDGLYFMVRVEGDAAERVSELTSIVCKEDRLIAMPRPKELLHVTVCPIGLFGEMPEDFQERAETAARSVTLRSFVAQFEYVMNFDRNSKDHPIVLVGDDGVIGFQLLWKDLCRGLGNVGLDRYLASSCTPHITIAYDCDRVSERYVVPVRWVVREFLLICSLVGRSRHVRLAGWALEG